MSQPPGLAGRADEQAALRGLLLSLGGGMSGALVLRGEPGIGKTTPGVRYTTFRNREDAPAAPPGCPLLGPEGRIRRRGEPCWTRLEASCQVYS